MSTPISRRDFVRTGAAAGVAAALPVPLPGAPGVIVRSAARPVVIASGNGNHIRNGGRMAAVETAFTRMAAGADVLDAIVAGVNLNELDPADSGGEFQLFTTRDRMLLGAAFFGSIGAAGGGVIGFVAPGSRWKDVPLVPRRARASAKGLRIASAGGSQVRASYTLPL